MIIVMRPHAAAATVDAVIATVESLGLTAHVSQGAERTVIGVVGIRDDKETLIAQFSQFDGVENVMPISRSYKLVSAEARTGRSIIRLKNGASFGGEQLEATARSVSQNGANVLRGGAFKPRTSPYAFQGMGEAGLRLLREIADMYGLAVVTEVMDVRDVELVAKYADMLQVGARNMQNFNLLREVGNVRVPVLLKRGLAATIDEWLMAAEYIVVSGNHDVVLCERGIRSFDPMTRNVLDLAAVPLVQSLSHLPVVVDPSHGTGVRSLVEPMAKAGIACGADGLIIEVHPNPAVAVSDGPQSLTLDGFAGVMDRLRPVADAVGRSLPTTVNAGV